MTLTEFLLERIAEDEEAARAAAGCTAGGTRWNAQQIDHEGLGVWADVWNDPPTVGEVSFDDPSEEPVLRYLVRHDPARVLAECEAKRRIVAELGSLVDYDRDLFVVQPYIESQARRTLTTLAVIYSDHPDYQSEWRAA